MEEKDINLTDANECLDKLFEEHDTENNEETVNSEQTGCGENCTCGDDCHCTEDDRCNPNCTCGEKSCSCGENCSCGDECDCGEECSCKEECSCSNENEENCSCSHDCDCGEDCDCTEEDKCNPNCNCGEEKPEVETQSTEDYFNHLLKLQAEFDNYRKRTEGDVSKAYKNGFTDAITDFLPALDSFKMATDMITDKNTLMGIQFIEKGILNTLEKMGVEVIDATGKFDPNFHQAIDTDSSADIEEGYIVKECYKGFKMGDKVIRYSQVIVKK